MDSEIAIYTAFDDHVANDIAEPEKNLMRAVLRTAMEDIRRTGEAHRDAHRFFMSGDDSYLYSFVSICNHLHVCSRTIRRVIGLMAAEDNEKLAA